MKTAKPINPKNKPANGHPMLGKRCMIRTIDAGIHIGKIAWINPNNSQEIILTKALRLWSWSDGGLSISALANNGVKKARINFTGNILLTQVIEMIPTTKTAEKTFKKFIEDGPK